MIWTMLVESLEKTLRVHSHRWFVMRETVNLIGCRREEGWPAFLTSTTQDYSNDATIKQVQSEKTKKL